MKRMVKNQKNRIRFNSLKFVLIFVEKILSILLNSFNFRIEKINAARRCLSIILVIREIFGDDFCSIADNHRAGTFFIRIGSAV